MSLRPFLAVLTAASLSSCTIFKKESDTTAADNYDAANAYGNTGGYPPANSYGNTTTGGYDAGNTYTQPYTQQPYTPPANTGSAYNSNPYSSTGSGTSAGGRSHKVVKGDTLSGLSRRYSVPVDAIRRANGLTNDTIRLDSTLVIP